MTDNRIVALEKAIYGRLSNNGDSSDDTPDLPMNGVGLPGESID
jgi:hypothetical protein